jgi:DNA (cytosine-5)-methyltransferase 1
LQIADVRAALLATGKPYVIENVKGARPHLIDPIELCGCMFGLNTYRARLFETSHPIAQPRHPKHTETLLPAGRGKKEGSSRFSLTSGGIKGVSQLERFAGMGYNEICMTNAELNESIPPAFSEYIGLQLMHAVTYREL